MTKKIFAQPEMKVVNMKRNDIITESTTVSFGVGEKSGDEACAPGRDSWDAGY